MDQCRFIYQILISFLQTWYKAENLKFQKILILSILIITDFVYATKHVTMLNR